MYEDLADIKQDLIDYYEDYVDSWFSNKPKKKNIKGDIK